MPSTGRCMALMKTFCIFLGPCGNAMLVWLHVGHQGGPGGPGIVFGGHRLGSNRNGGELVQVHVRKKHDSPASRKRSAPSGPQWLQTGFNLRANTSLHLHTTIHVG